MFMQVQCMLLTSLYSYILMVMCECSYVYVIHNKVIWLAKYLVCILHADPYVYSGHD